ncbi:hypothetical protein IWX63_003344 [Arthrobacter sp. CAN_A2]
MTRARSTSPRHPSDTPGTCEEHKPHPTPRPAHLTRARSIRPTTPVRHEGSDRRTRCISVFDRQRPAGNTRSHAQNTRSRRQCSRSPTPRRQCRPAARVADPRRPESVWPAVPGARSNRLTPTASKSASSSVADFAGLCASCQQDVVAPLGLVPTPVSVSFDAMGRRSSWPISDLLGSLIAGLRVNSSQVFARLLLAPADGIPGFVAAGCIPPEYITPALRRRPEWRGRSQHQDTSRIGARHYLSAPWAAPALTLGRVGIVPPRGPRATDVHLGLRQHYAP